jgi:hypothetical protein
MGSRFRLFRQVPSSGRFSFSLKASDGHPERRPWDALPTARLGAPPRRTCRTPRPAALGIRRAATMTASAFPMCVRRDGRIHQHKLRATLDQALRLALRFFGKIASTSTCFARQWSKFHSWKTPWRFSSARLAGGPDLPPPGTFPSSASGQGNPSPQSRRRRAAAGPSGPVRDPVPPREARRKAPANSLSRPVANQWRRGYSTRPPRAAIPRNGSHPPAPRPPAGRRLGRRATFPCGGAASAPPMRAAMGRGAEIAQRAPVAEPPEGLRACRAALRMVRSSRIRAS